MRAVAAILTLALLGGCAAPAQKTPATAPAAAKPATAPQQAARPAPAAEPEAEPVVLPPPDSLLGRDAGEVAELLGDPSFRRRDKPAELWQFRGEACVLDLFLYPPATGGQHQVTHYGVRGRGQQTRTARDCFHDLLRARAAAAKVSS